MARERTFIFRLVAASILMAALVVWSSGAMAQGAGEEKAFVKYQQAIKKAFGIDIRNFRESLPGGRADGQKITKYDLRQLLMGIDVELEHTKDRMRALEIAMDHLEEIPDYYTRLEKMEKDAEKSLRKR